ncbi:MAG: urease accessory protein [Gammaproteobacteria bacterium]|jgi:urease accessory protein
MEHDTKRMWGYKPYVFTDLKDDIGLDTVTNFIVDQGMR